MIPFSIVPRRTVRPSSPHRRPVDSPNAPSALAMRTAFCTPALVASVSLNALKAARKGRRPSEEDIVAWQGLARQSIWITEVARVHGLTFEQKQLIAELELLHAHVTALDDEITQITASAREGQILTSLDIHPRSRRNASGDAAYNEWYHCEL